MQVSYREEMNLSEGKGASTSGTWKGGVGGDVVADQFPAGLRVLIVDDDPICLKILEKMLLTCLYKVTKCNRAEIALSLLRQDRNGFDIVISDVHMPDMDGFKLLEHIGLEMDLPVIMMSVDDGKNVVMKGVTHGACDYLIKPVRIEAVKNIWQHVVRKKKKEQKDLEQSGSVEDCDRQLKASDDLDYASSGNEEIWRNSKKRKDEEEEAEDRDDSSTLKKPRVVWSVELHQQFVAAVHQLGIDKAVPKKILELMNVQGLTRENVASHLQKYRLYLRRVSGASQLQNGLGSSFMTSQEATFGSVPSLYEVDFQALAASGQLPAQSLATLQAAATLGRSSSPLVDQRNLLSFENPKLRFREVQPPQHQQQHTNSNSKPVNLLHGIPTLGVKQLAANFHPSVQSFHNSNMQANALQRQNAHLPMQITQQQERPGQLNDQFSKQQSVSQPILSNMIINQGVLEKNGILENGRGTRFNAVSQTPPVVNFSMTQNMPAAKGVFQEDGNSDTKQPIGFVPTYDIFNEMHQKKTHDWDSQNVGLTFNASRHTNSGFLADHGTNRNVGSVGKATFVPVERSEHRNVQNINELMDPFVAQNSIKIKAERNPNPNYEAPFFQEDYGQEDLMSALLKQQEGTGPAETEFDFDGYSIDNIPV